MPVIGSVEDRDFLELGGATFDRERAREQLQSFLGRLRAAGQDGQEEASIGLHGLTVRRVAPDGAPDLATQELNRLEVLSAIAGLPFLCELTVRWFLAGRSPGQLARHLHMKRRQVENAWSYALDLLVNRIFDWTDEGEQLARGAQAIR